MQATLKLKLTTENTQDFLETMRLYTECYNAVCSFGWSAFEINKFRLHSETYYPLRELFPSLPSQLVCSARDKASESLKSLSALEKSGLAVNRPESKFCPIRYDGRSYWVNLESGEASLATVSGRVKVNFQVCSYYRRKYAGWKVTSADLCLNNGSFYLHVVVQSDSPVVETTDVLGVDLGIVNLAVDSDGNVYQGEQVAAYRKRVARNRAALQKKGTKSAKRHLKRIYRKTSNYAKNVNHHIANAIVKNAASGRKALALEDLTGIRDCSNRFSKELRRSMGEWAFFQLGSFIAYKADRRGLPVVRTDPAYSSQECSLCGHIDKQNRKDQSSFVCQKCGLMMHADHNAACNHRFRAAESLTLKSDSLSSRETLVYAQGQATCL